MWRVSLFLVLAASGLAEDPVARLARSIEEGKVQLQFDEERGYLPWLLQSLDIPPESRMLVFSKTGVQALRTEPANPRRIYFNDAVIVATVNGGPIEIAAQDPQRGLIFYLLDQTPFRYRELMASPKPASPFARRTDCIHCHGSGTLIRSVVTDPSGVPLDRYGSRDTDNRTSFDKLWGGWFVTGKATGKHMGNVVIGADGKQLTVKPPGTSDVAALLVFEHQARVMNLIAQARIQELGDALLFLDEAPLPEPVEGSSGFAEKFRARGPLRDLDLRTRLMRYPCSYMIYSEAFQALPASAKRTIYARITDPAVVNILRETLPDFRPATQSAAPR